MKKHLIILAAIALMAFGGCFRPAGDPVTMDFDIEGSYTELQVEDAFDVTVDTAATQVTVTAGDNVMPKVVVKNVDNTLRIYLKGWGGYWTAMTDMKVVMPYNADLTSVRLSGASEFRSEYGLQGEEVSIRLSGASDFYGDIVADKIKMDLSGSSDVGGNVTATDLELEMSGSSDAELEGQVATLKIDFSGSSTLVEKVAGNRYALVCDQCEGEMSGASDAYIHCDGSIKVSLSGSSDLHYTGNASTADCRCSGSSNVIHHSEP